MSTLIIAEHDHLSLKPATLNVVSAAVKLGQPITHLVAGYNAGAAAQAAAAVTALQKSYMLMTSYMLIFLLKIWAH